MTPPTQTTVLESAIDAHLSDDIDAARYRALRKYVTLFEARPPNMKLRLSRARGDKRVGMGETFDTVADALIMGDLARAEQEHSAPETQ